MREIVVKGEDARPDSSIRQIVEAAQDEKHQFATAAYDESSISEREVKFALITGTLYLYTRYNDTLYRVALTAV